MADLDSNKEPIVVRAARSDDLAAIHGVAVQTWRATYSGLIPDIDIDAALDLWYAPVALARRLGPGLFVAVRGTAIIGFAQVGLNPEHDAELFALYVLPHEQGSGVGWRLWRRALARVREFEKLDMVVWVLATNEKARRFYQRQDATFVAERTISIANSRVTETGFRVASE